MARKRGNKITKFITTILTWVGAAVLYFTIFSLLFDTPKEYELRHSTDRMKAEYEALSARYDSLNLVVNNVIERDRNIFGILFESAPYDFNSDYEQQRLALHESLLDKSKGRMLKDVVVNTDNIEQKLQQLEQTYSTLQSKLDSLDDKSNNIPSIQPVINHQLSLLTGDMVCRCTHFIVRCSRIRVWTTPFQRVRVSLPLPMVLLRMCWVKHPLRA